MLQQARDRDLALRELFGNAGERAGAVLDVQPEVEG